MAYPMWPKGVITNVFSTPPLELWNCPQQLPRSSVFAASVRPPWGRTARTYRCGTTESLPDFAFEEAVLKRTSTAGRTLPTNRPESWSSLSQGRLSVRIPKTQPTSVSPVALGDRRLSAANVPEADFTPGSGCIVVQRATGASWFRADIADFAASNVKRATLGAQV